MTNQTLPKVALIPIISEKVDPQLNAALIEKIK